MRARRPKHPRSESSPHVNPNAAGLDIGSDEIWACVPEDRDTEPVRAFGTLPGECLPSQARAGAQE